MSAARARRGSALAVALGFALAGAAAAGEPPRLGDARIETVAGTAPAAAIAAARGEALWIGWSVATVAGAESVCCGWSEGSVRACSLAEEDRGWSMTDDRGSPRRLFVLAEAAGGRVRRLKQFSPDCAVDGDGRRVVWLDEVATGASLDALEPLLAAAEEVRERAHAAIAFHDDPRADRILERRALDRSLDGQQREHAIFWAGNLRGEAGYRLLERVLSGEEPDLRRHALFALTQSSHPGAIDRLKRAAAGDPDDEVRSQGLFWLAQSDAPGAGEWILDRMAAERDDQVREQAVFALSQLDDGADWLLRVLRESRDPRVVRQALFWLGDSDDPRALAELEKILSP